MDRVGLGSLVPVEYFENKNLEFLSDNKTVRRFEVSKLVPVAINHHANLATTSGVVILGYLF